MLLLRHARVDRDGALDELEDEGLVGQRIGLGLLPLLLRSVLVAVLARRRKRHELRVLRPLGPLAGVYQPHLVALRGPVQARYAYLSGKLVRI